MTGGLHKSGRRARPIVDINMVPLIDVSLVLLIIFMVMTPFLVQQQIKVNLPSSVSGNEAADRPVIVVITKEGGVSLAGRALAVNQLESELRSQMASQERPVVIQADKDIPLQRVVSVMDIAKRANVNKLGISVEQPK
jgi:biopolymer transport protein ExbD